MSEMHSEVTVSLLDRYNEEALKDRDEWINDLLILLDEQFKEEGKLDENVKEHFETFLQHARGLSQNCFWVLMAHCQSEEGNRVPAGFLCLSFLPKMNIKRGYSYVDELFVRDSCRRKGVAFVLLEKAKSITQERKLAGIRLLVRSENVTAQQLYTKQGFVLSDTKFGQCLTKNFDPVQ